MVKLKFAIILCCIFSMASCTHSENERMIIGSWHGSSWSIGDKPSGRDVESTHFTFNDKGEYVYEYSGTKESGKYKIEHDMLFTTPVNQQEMMVKITKLTTDTLVFDMNRSGEAETLTLVRSK